MENGYKKAMLLAFLLCMLLTSVASAQGEAEAEVAAAGWIAMASGIAMAGSAIGAGWAIASTGTAATGATTEKPEVFGRVLIFVALAEAIAIYGLLIAFMLWTKI